MPDLDAARHLAKVAGWRDWVPWGKTPEPDEPETAPVQPAPSEPPTPSPGLPPDLVGPSGTVTHSWYGMTATILGSRTTGGAYPITGGKGRARRPESEGPGLYPPVFPKEEGRKKAPFIPNGTEVRVLGQGKGRPPERGEPRDLSRREQLVDVVLCELIDPDLPETLIGTIWGFRPEDVHEGAPPDVRRRPAHRLAQKGRVLLEALDDDDNLSGVSGVQGNTVGQVGLGLGHGLACGAAVDLVAPEGNVAVIGSHLRRGLDRCHANDTTCQEQSRPENDQKRTAGQLAGFKTKRIIDALEAAGFTFKYHGGRHDMYEMAGTGRHLAVATHHKKDYPEGLLGGSLLREAGIDKKTFLAWDAYAQGHGPLPPALEPGFPGVQQKGKEDVPPVAEDVQPGLPGLAVMHMTEEEYYTVAEAQPEFMDQYPLESFLPNGYQIQDLGDGRWAITDGWFLLSEEEREQVLRTVMPKTAARTAAGEPVDRAIDEMAGSDMGMRMRLEEAARSLYADGLDDEDVVQALRTRRQRQRLERAPEVPGAHLEHETQSHWIFKLDAYEGAEALDKKRLWCITRDSSVWDQYAGHGAQFWVHVSKETGEPEWVVAQMERDGRKAIETYSADDELQLEDLPGVQEWHVQERGVRDLGVEFYGMLKDVAAGNVDQARKLVSGAWQTAQALSRLAEQGLPWPFINEVLASIDRMAEDGDIGALEADEWVRQVDESRTPSGLPHQANDKTPDRVINAHSVPLLRKANDPVSMTVTWQGIDVAIEWEAGSVREYDDSDYKQYITPPYSYGYIRGTEGEDGEELDCFVNMDSQDVESVYVVVQRAGEYEDENTDLSLGQFDEFDVVLGARDEAEAEGVMRLHYDRAQVGTVFEVPVEEFKLFVLPQIGAKEARTHGPQTDRTLLAWAQHGDRNTRLLEKIESMGSPAFRDWAGKFDTPEKVGVLEHVVNQFGRADAWAFQKALADTPGWVRLSVPPQHLPAWSFVAGPEEAEEWITLLQHEAGSASPVETLAEEAEAWTWQGFDVDDARVAIEAGYSSPEAAAGTRTAAVIGVEDTERGVNLEDVRVGDTVRLLAGQEGLRTDAVCEVVAVHAAGPALRVRGDGVQQDALNGSWSTGVVEATVPVGDCVLILNPEDGRLG